MTKLSYSTEEILAHHPYARPHTEAGYKLHGGFDADGKYISPRTLNRWPAIQAWSDALKSKGHDVVDASPQLLVGDAFPSAAQQKFLLELGLGQTLWDSLTITGFDRSARPAAGGRRGARLPGNHRRRHFSDGRRPS